MTVKRLFRAGTAALIAAFALLGAVGMLPAGAQAASGGVRFVHALPGAAGVDVFVDGTLAARDLEYGTATRYLNVSLGSHKVVVTPTGTGSAPSGTPLLSTTVSPDATNPDLLVVVEGTSDKPEAGVFPQDLSALDAGKTRFTAVHAV